MGGNKSRSAPKKKSSQTSVDLAGRDLPSVLSSKVADWPEVTVQSKFHNLSFLVEGKVFAFTRRDAVVLKLPEEKIQKLVEQRRGASFLVMGKRTMREWVVLSHDEMNHNPNESLNLFQQAMTFVLSLRKSKS
ncbi:MAG: hypothetical protein ACYCPO_07800 [Acidobacteriaceae bacterium]